MKTFKEVEAFVRKAMDKNLLINIRADGEIAINTNEYAVYFYKYKRLECYDITISLYNHKGTFVNHYAISITDKESALFDLLVADINDYIQTYTKDILDNFFSSKENNRTKTIDDLEFDDENNIE